MEIFHDIYPKIWDRVLAVSSRPQFLQFRDELIEWILLGSTKLNFNSSLWLVRVYLHTSEVNSWTLTKIAQVVHRVRVYTV